MSTNPTISLRAARVNANYTRQQAAELIGVSTTTIKNWECGRTEPSMAKFRKLCELYKLPGDFIFLPKS